MNQFISPKIEPFKPKPHPWGFSFDVESNYEKLLPVVLILESFFNDREIAPDVLIMDFRF